MPVHGWHEVGDDRMTPDESGPEQHLDLLLFQGRQVQSTWVQRDIFRKGYTPKDSVRRHGISVVLATLFLQVAEERAIVDQCLNFDVSCLRYLMVCKNEFEVDFTLLYHATAPDA